ncbi:hypothetical protein A2866_01415 [Candidatus Roizmanbacteria bacterium RIFCSPHIGHO2_01_FULL_39_8]|uniref:Uncharacterized protein n=1 Tax=Candidatus Roizmanbacteria bacterium RIFCSPHIGHO2_01_FULL_39_8 TaxID=1802033 RepID=A0A1F7GKP2_9BACT|nr:MAG: hypothetical protein A2866_01415 [Candidatus Roizmanbacteria bacterium RIFCSPHIGHO2_01_FULL_39_8]
MALIENGSYRITRRQFFILAIIAGLGLDNLNALAADNYYQEQDVLIDLAYPETVRQSFESRARNWSNWFQYSANSLGVKLPSLDSFNTSQFNHDSIIQSVSPRSHMVFVPGAGCEELWDWVERDYLPWMAAFESVRTGKKYEETYDQKKKYVDAIEIEKTAGLARKQQLRQYFQTMMPNNTPVLPWGFVTSGRDENGALPPERPEDMVVFIAEYMKWILQNAPDTEFILWGHSLGANTLHSLLRLFQGGIFSDLAQHTSHTILHSQALNDLTNQLLYNLGQGPLGLLRFLHPSSDLNMSTGLNNAVNIGSILLNAASNPAYFGQLNPSLLKEKYHIGVTSIYSPQDPASTGVPGAHKISIDYFDDGSVVSVQRGIVPKPSKLFTVPRSFSNLWNTLDSPYHKPSPSAIKDLFGLAVV